MEPSTARKSRCASKNALRVVKAGYWPREGTRSPSSLGSRTDGSPLQRSPTLHSPRSLNQICRIIERYWMLVLLRMCFPGMHQTPRPSFVDHNQRSLKPQTPLRWLGSLRRPFRMRCSTRTGTSLTPTAFQRCYRNIPQPCHEPTSTSEEPRNEYHCFLCRFVLHRFRWDERSFGGDGGRQEKPRSAWCLVDVSELEHCKSVCGCPDGRRGCETSCTGWKVFLPVPLAVVRKLSR